MKGVIFDLDGTLLDSMPVWENAAALYLRSVGVEGEEGLAAKLFPLSLMEGATYLKQRYQLPHSLQAIADGVNGVIERAYRESIPLKEGARELLETLSERGIPMAIATATDRNVLVPALRRLGVLGHFKGIFTCSEVGAGKALSPAVYEAAARHMGLANGACWVFEDAVHALRTARAAGFHTVGVFDHASRAEWALIGETADVSLQSLARPQAFFRAMEEGV